MARHMAIQMTKIEGKLRTVDLIIEVHDARVALTGRNPNIAKKLASVRPHILVMNKMDLIDVKNRAAVEDHYHGQGVSNIVWTDCRDRLKKPLTHLRKMILEMLKGEMRFNRAVKTEYQMMVVGIPNVGKSSLINSLRMHNQHKGKAVMEGPNPGVTLKVQNKVRILDSPLLYVLDTPGVIDPYYRDETQKLKLSLCNLLIKESAADKISIAHYLLEFMNRNLDYSYHTLLGLPDQPPYYDAKKLLAHVCQVKDLRRQVLIGGERHDRWQFDHAAELFVHLYQNQKIAGDCFLDRDLL